MTIYYVGIGGSDAADGQTWANRKETLNGAENIPVVAGDTVYVGPGTYREMLTVDVNGTSGNEISYIADVTGANTDGVGGKIRVTGSDNDQTATRTHCIYSATYGAYRIFNGFHVDLSSTTNMFLYSTNGSIFEYCVFGEVTSASLWTVSRNQGLNDYILTFRNCIFLGSVNTQHYGVPNTSSFDFINCLFFMVTGFEFNHYHIRTYAPVTANNCLFYGGKTSVYAAYTPSDGFSATNCLWVNNDYLWDKSTQGEIYIDNCTYTDYSGIGEGATVPTNSNTWSALLESPLLYAGYRLPNTFGHLSEWSFLRGIAGDGSEESIDFWGLTRPTTATMKSRGAVQFTDISYEATIKQTADASVEMREAEREHAYIRVMSPVTTVRVKVYREADYTGVLPQLVLRSPGTATRTLTDTGSAETWNQLELSIAAEVNDYFLVELVSNNTSSAGNFRVLWDDFDVAY